MQSKNLLLHSTCLTTFLFLLFTCTHNSMNQGRTHNLNSLEPINTTVYARTDLPTQSQSGFQIHSNTLTLPLDRALHHLNKIKGPLTHLELLFPSSRSEQICKDDLDAIMNKLKTFQLQSLRMPYYSNSQDSFITTQRSLQYLEIDLITPITESFMRSLGPNLRSLVIHDKYPRKQHIRKRNARAQKKVTNLSALSAPLMNQEGCLVWTWQNNLPIPERYYRLENAISFAPSSLLELRLIGSNANSAQLGDLIIEALKNKKNDLKLKKLHIENIYSLDSASFLASNYDELSIKNLPISQANFFSGLNSVTNLVLNPNESSVEIFKHGSEVEIQNLFITTKDNLKLRGTKDLLQINITYKITTDKEDWSFLSDSETLKRVSIQNFIDPTSLLKSIAPLKSLDSIHLHEFKAHPDLKFKALKDMNLINLTLCPTDYGLLIGKSTPTDKYKYDDFILFDFEWLAKSTNLNALHLGQFSYNNLEILQERNSLSELTLEFSSSGNLLAADNTPHQLRLLESTPKSLVSLTLQNADFKKIIMVKKLDNVNKLTLKSCKSIDKPQFKNFIVSLPNLETLHIEQSNFSTLHFIQSIEKLNELLISADRPIPISISEIKTHKEKLNNLKTLEIPVLDSESPLHLFDLQTEGRSYRFRVVN